MLIFGYINNQQWIIRKSNYTKRIIKTNFYNRSGCIGIGNEADSNNIWAALNESKQELRLSENTDGSYNILIQGNLSREDALTIPESENIIGARARWCMRTDSDSQKWYLERVNYQKGDINMDGKINNVDLQQLNQYLESEVSLSEARLFLADVNNDGLISLADVISLNDKIAEFA